MIDLSQFPPSTRGVLEGYSLTPAIDGESGGSVLRMDAAGRPSCYLKHGTDAIATAITDEMARLAWLTGRVAVPRIVHFERSHNAAYLVTTALPGRSAYDLLVERPAQRVMVARALGTFLRAWHALPTVDCPFRSDRELRLAAARRRLEAGEVDESDFDEAREGMSAEAVWEVMVALRAGVTGDAPVVTHGDFSLGNVYLSDAGADVAVTGAFDVALAGVADRYQDVAIAWRDLGDFGEEAQRAFLASYGIDAPDLPRLEFHLCLDEFF